VTFVKNSHDSRSEVFFIASRAREGQGISYNPQSEISYQSGNIGVEINHCPEINEPQLEFLFPDETEADFSRSAIFPISVAVAKSSVIA